MLCPPSVLSRSRFHSKVIELGEITSGRAAGRTGTAQVTVCDLTGTGVQDVAIAVRALRAATEQGLGREA